MAQEIQTECRPCESTEEPGRTLESEVAYAPSIVEIGFIDEADDGRSDTSETSLSEETSQDTAAILAVKASDDDSQPHNGHIGHESDSSCEVNHVPATDDSVPSLHLVASSPSRAVNFIECFENGINVETKHNVETCLNTSALVEENGDISDIQADGKVPQLSENHCESQTLDESMDVLKSSMQNGSAISSFEKLPKRKDNLEMEMAKLSENTPKNRYKDVLPYDESRVAITECETGDYINASFVEMQVPGATNSYIATQGPLPHTCEEFWQMIWEHNCSIIVMVTTLKERNRVKCHQYWPDLGETITHAGMQIVCFGETTTPAGITRELLLIHETKNQERHVIQMQHVTWPDHGVPEDATDFIEFIQQLREWRKLLPGQVVVHCSAGVGRTGVLILMETAMCLIEDEKPVCPLELVRTMRDQRVMMVQTIGQYKFICEAVLKLYNDHRAKSSELQSR